MPHLSSSFSSQSAGTLTVTLSGTFFQGASRDAGFPSTTGGAANMMVRGVFGVAGSYSKTEPIDRYAPTAVTQVAYPGGGVVWSLFTETVAYIDTTGTANWSYGILNLLLTANLLKK